MLDDYREKQNVAYGLMMNEIYSNSISHAYLIDENNNNESFDIVMAFIKEIFCKDLTDNDALILRKRIDDGNYAEVKVIEPDGMLIRKQQILDLQQEFSRAAIEGSKRIYVIVDADRMRSETANSMLKFLEEPDNDIIAILMTNNFNNILPTIVSRCQVIRLNGNGKNVCDKETEEVIIEFIKMLENQKIRAIINGSEALFRNINYKDRDKLIDFFDKMIDMYYDILKILYGDTNILFVEYIKELTGIAKINTDSVILKKINFLVDVKDSIKNNVNINLLIDNLIVSFGGM